MVYVNRRLTSSLKSEPEHSEETERDYEECDTPEYRILDDGLEDVNDEHGSEPGLLPVECVYSLPCFLSS